MARDLTRCLPRGLALAAAGFGLALCAAAAWADRVSNEALPDPTRPPAAFIKPLSGADEAGRVDREPEPSGLQSVIVRKGRKPVAIIGGERVELGGKYGDARLIKVSETGVVLAGPSGTETLRLTPAVVKKPVVEPRIPAKRKKKPSGNAANGK